MCVEVLCLSVAVGHVEMSNEELMANIALSINFLVSLLKKVGHPPSPSLAVPSDPKCVADEGGVAELAERALRPHQVHDGTRPAPLLSLDSRVVCSATCCSLNKELRIGPL